MIKLVQPIPCPFCGGTELEIRPVVFRHWNVHCTHCHCKGPVGESPDKAVMTWNNHHNPSIQKRKEIQMADIEDSKTDKIWKACRALRTFTVSQVQRITEIEKRETVRKYIYLLEQCGYLRIEGQKNAPGAPNVYHIVRSKVIEAPDWHQLRYPEADEAMRKEDIKDLRNVKVKAKATA